MQLDQHTRRPSTAPSTSARPRDVREPPRDGTEPNGSRRTTASFGLAAAIGRLLGGDPPIAVELLRRQPHRPRRLRRRRSSSAHPRRSATRSPRRASSASHGRTCRASSTSRATSSRRSRSATTFPTSASAPSEWLDLARIAGVAGPAPAAAAARGGAPARPPSLEGARRGGDRAPLRRLERLLPAGPRAVDDVLVRRVAVGGRRRSRPRRPPKYELVCRKLGLEPGMRLLDVGCGWGGMVLHAARHHGVRRGRRHALAPAGRVGAPRRARRRPRRPGRDPRAGLPRRARRAVRRDQLDRHVRARRRRAARRVLRDAVRACCARAAGCSTTASRVPASERRAPALRAPRLHRPLRVPRRRAPRGRQRRVAHPARRLRGAPRRGPPRALRAHAARLGAQPRGRRGRGGRRGRRRRAPACGASTWPRRRSNFEAGRTQIHQVLAVRDDHGASGFALRPHWEPIATGRVVSTETRTRRSAEKPRAPSQNDGARVRGSSGGRSFSAGIVSPTIARRARIRARILRRATTETRR